MKNTAFGRMSFDLLYQCLTEGAKRHDRELIQGILQGIDSSSKENCLYKAYNESNNRVWQLLAADMNAIITFTEEESNDDVDLLILGVVKLNEKEYLVALPYDENNSEQDEEEVIILEIEDLDGEESYLSLKDEEEIGKVFEVFEQEYPESWYIE